jgi:hypothetical protein
LQTKTPAKLPGLTLTEFSLIVCPVRVENSIREASPLDGTEVGLKKASFVPSASQNGT